MADFNAIAAVSRTLRRLLIDRMATAGVAVTLVPPDVTLGGVSGERVNAYLYAIEEDAQLRNDALPGREHPAGYGLPALSLALRYLLTSHARSEDAQDSDLIAQALLGDALLALHDWGGRIEEMRLVTNRAGAIGDRLLDPVLHDEFERVKLVIARSAVDDLAKLWSAMPQANYRRSAVVEARIVQIESRRLRRQAPPVETRRILLTVARPPVIVAAYRTPPPPPADTLRDQRIAVGEPLTIEHLPITAERLYVRLGGLAPIRVALPSPGRIDLAVPDDAYPIDPDHAVARPIPADQRLQPGALEVRLVAADAAEGVQGGIDRGTALAAERTLTSNTLLLQLVPQVTATAPPNGTDSAVLRVTGSRLWTADGTTTVLLGDVAIPVRAPRAGDAWAAPTPTQVEVPLSGVGSVLRPRPAPYPVSIEVNGARARATGHSFRLDP